MVIIGITGTLGAGKGTVVEYLTAEKGFVHFSVRAFLLEEIRKRRLPENRDSMVVVANDLRQRHGSSYVTDCLYHRAAARGNDCIIESIRTPGEIASLRTKGTFILLAVDADPKVRFSRIALRGSETDHIDYETFLANEAREMTAADPAAQNLQACIREADYLLTNNGSREELFAQVEQVLHQVSKE
ncbi:MAG TPA: AAA family ATPase [Bacteroidales bacterium]|nr:AAA family ATPase [Bacteroidales bacterium]